MTLLGGIFYLVAALMIVSTAMAVTRNNLVHAVLYLVVSFFGSAALFFLLGAPLLAVLEVIIYAGAIMILFLFIVMMLKIDTSRSTRIPIGHLGAAGAICGIYFGACILLVYFSEPAAKEPMRAALVHPKDFGRHLFAQHWLAVEVVSLLLLIALIGALHLGRRGSRNKGAAGDPSGESFQHELENRKDGGLDP
jgi:NADH-quinone oxidoreductase subunit J